jgi:hypothetical protein
MSEERSLADEPEVKVEDLIVDTTPDVPLEDFDFAEFLHGARPTRRSAKLYMRADLIGQLEELIQDIEAEGGDPAEDPKVRELYDTFHSSGRWFTVEKKSGEWETKFRQDTINRLSIKVDKDGNVLSAADGLAIAFEQTAAQIVVPTGVTAEGLRELYDINQGEVNKLFLAVRLANSEMAETVRVVGPDFSSKPSTSSSGAGS